MLKKVKSFFKLIKLNRKSEIEILKLKIKKAENLVEALEFFATEQFYKKTSFVTTRKINLADSFPVNITVNENPILSLGLDKAQKALKEWRVNE